METQNIENNANFPVKKILWSFFSRFTECDKPQGKIYEGPQGFPTNTVEVTRSFLKHLSGW